MTCREHESQSILRGTKFVTILACLSCLTMGCAKKVSKNSGQNAPSSEDQIEKLNNNDERNSASHRQVQSPPAASAIPRKLDAQRLNPLLLEGYELHDSLRTEQPEAISDLPAGMPLPQNPHFSTDAAFVEATARGGSQGRLDGEGMRSALYARYVTGESTIGFYGLEAESEAAADQREKLIREIWAHNASLNRTRVYRRGLVLAVVWLRTPGKIPGCWEAVNEKVEKLLDLCQP